MAAAVLPPSLHRSSFLLQENRASPPPTDFAGSFYSKHLKSLERFTASYSSSIGISKRYPKAISTGNDFLGDEDDWFPSKAEPPTHLGNSFCHMISNQLSRLKSIFAREDDLFPFEEYQSLKPNLSVGSRYRGFRLFSLCFLVTFLTIRPPDHAFALPLQGEDGIVKIIPWKAWLSGAAGSGYMFLNGTFPLHSHTITTILAFSGPIKSLVFPLINYIHPLPTKDDKILKFFGSALPWLLPIIEKRLCVVISAISIISWGYAYQITKAGELKTFYPLFGVGLDVFLILFGQRVKIFSVPKKSFGRGMDGRAIILLGTISIVALIGPVIVAWWVNARDPPLTPKKKVAKTRVPAERKKTKKNEGALRSPRRSKRREQIKDKTKPQQRNRIGVRITEVEVETERI